ncbi:MAG TPA: hypothetical protein DEA50_05755 [Parvularcula sp.]|nr:hypothetical protein [Parvularcula sp.]
MNRPARKPAAGFFLGIAGEAGDPRCALRRQSDATLTTSREKKAGYILNDDAPAERRLLASLCDTIN